MWKLDSSRTTLEALENQRKGISTTTPHEAGQNISAIDKLRTLLCSSSGMHFLAADALRSGVSWEA